VGKDSFRGRIAGVELKASRRLGGDPCGRLIGATAPPPRWRLRWALESWNVLVFAVAASEKDLQQKEAKLMELQEFYETRLLQHKVNLIIIIIIIHRRRSLLGRAGGCPPTFQSFWAKPILCPPTFCG